MAALAALVMLVIVGSLAELLNDWALTDLLPIKYFVFIALGIAVSALSLVVLLRLFPRSAGLAAFLSVLCAGLLGGAAAQLAHAMSWVLGGCLGLAAGFVLVRFVTASGDEPFEEPNPFAVDWKDEDGE